MIPVSLTTVSENIARFLAIFGITAVVAMVGVGVYQATLVDDVYEEIGPDQLTDDGTPDPAQLSGGAKADWQDAMTIQGWSQPVLLLGLGSILTAIILTFAIVIYRGVKTMGEGLPEFWRAYLNMQTGQNNAVPDRVDDDVELPFGGGTR